MAPTYTLNYKRSSQVFWRRYENVTGHAYDKKLDRLVLFFSKGEIVEIAKWSDCSIRLGLDWVLADKTARLKAGQPPQIR